jgi:hypothetical protein
MERRIMQKTGTNGGDIQDIRKNATSPGLAHLAIKLKRSPWFQEETFALVGLIMLIFYL